MHHVRDLPGLGGNELLRPSDGVTATRRHRRPGLKGNGPIRGVAPRTGPGDRGRNRRGETARSEVGHCYQGDGAEAADSSFEVSWTWCVDSIRGRSSRAMSTFRLIRYPVAVAIASIG